MAFLKSMWLIVLVLGLSLVEKDYVCGIRLRDSLEGQGGLESKILEASTSTVNGMQGQEKAPNATQLENAANKAVETSKDSLKNAADEAEKMYAELPHWAQITVCVVSILIGLVLLFKGYAFLGFALFLVCGVFFSVLLFGILNATIAESASNRAAIIWGVSASVGLLCGLLCGCNPKIGGFVLGASAGVFLAVMLNPVALHYIWPSQPTINLYIWMGVFGVTCGIFVMCCEYPMMVTATSLAGAFVMIVGIGQLAGNFPAMGTDFSGDIVWQWWAYFGGFCALFGLGLAVQFCYTAQKESNNGHYQKM